MFEEPTNDDPKTPVPTAKGPGMSSGMRALRNGIGIALLGIMLGNLLVAAAPEWLSSVRASLPACCSGKACSGGTCPTGGGCCSDMTSIGLPNSVLEQSAQGQLEAEETAAKQSETAE